MEVYKHHQSILFNLHFWNPYNLQLKNFVVSNEKFCPMGMKTGIPRKRKYDFSLLCPHFYGKKIAFVLTVESSFYT